MAGFQPRSDSASGAVEITGWRPGLRKIALNEAMRQKAGLSLREAKDRVADVLERRPVRLTPAADVSAEDLLRAVQAAGAEARRM